MIVQRIARHRVGRIASARSPPRSVRAATAGPAVDTYLDLLAARAVVNAWNDIPAHPAGDNPVFEWFAGAGLRPYLDALGTTRTPGPLPNEIAQRLR